MKNIPIVILYVADQKKSRDFYKTVLGTEPLLDVTGMTEFKLTDHLKLGLMPEKGIEKILLPATKSPSLAHGVPRCEIYLFSNEPEEYWKRAIENSGIGISPLQMRDWGDEVAYCTDLDGHVLAFARMK